jgi:hypothetical protein
MFFSEFEPAITAVKRTATGIDWKKIYYHHNRNDYLNHNLHRAHHVRGVMSKDLTDWRAFAF